MINFPIDGGLVVHASRLHFVEVSMQARHLHYRVPCQATNREFVLPEFLNWENELLNAKKC